MARSKDELVAAILILEEKIHNSQLRLAILYASREQLREELSTLELRDL